MYIYIYTCIYIHSDSDSERIYLTIYYMISKVIQI